MKARILFALLCVAAASPGDTGPGEQVILDFESTPLSQLFGKPQGTVTLSRTTAPTFTGSEPTGPGGKALGVTATQGAFAYTRKGVLCATVQIPCRAAEADSLPVRSWSSLGGKRIYARLVDANGDTAELELRSGKRLGIRLNRLSARDRAYVAANAHRVKQTPPPETAAPPPPTATAPDTTGQPTDGAMETRSYTVNLESLGIGDGQDAGRQLGRLLREQDIKFETDARLQYDAAAQKLKITNTATQLDAIERLLARMNVVKGTCAITVSLHKLGTKRAEDMRRFIGITMRFGRRIEIAGEMESAMAEFQRQGAPPAICSLDVNTPSGRRFKAAGKGALASATFSGTAFVHPGAKRATLSFAVEILPSGSTAPITGSASADAPVGTPFIVLVKGEVDGIGGKTRTEYYICRITLTGVK